MASDQNQKSTSEDSGDNNGNVYKGYKGWGDYMAAKRSKLSAQFEAEAQRERVGFAPIFKGICIYVNGYTDPTAVELKQMILRYGGEYHVYKTSKTSHVVASNLALSKIHKLTDKQRVVRPEWIVDSIKAGQLLPEHNYLLYTTAKSSANVKNESKGQDGLPVQVGETEMAAGRSIAGTTDERFLKEFYGQSRLHFISTLAQELKDKVREKQQSSEDCSQACQKMCHRILADRVGPSTTSDGTYLSKSGGSFIAHLDMDCFFVSVSLQNHPELRNMPVVVAHSRGRGSVGSSWSEIASCNYEARKCGIKNGMMLGRAMELCPNVRSIPYDFDRCKQIAFTFFSFILRHTVNVEAISCDEMYVDLTDLCSSMDVSVAEIVSYFRREIYEAVGCTVSAGIGPNKLIARLATKAAKPNGQLLVTAGEVDKWILSLPVADLPGVGRAALTKLQRLGVSTCADLQRIDAGLLRRAFGEKFAQALQAKSRGLDAAPVRTEPCRKSLSCDVNYGIRLKNNDEMVAFVKRLCAEVASRLRAAGIQGRTFTLKLMIRAPDASSKTMKFLGHGICNSASKSTTLPTYTDDANTIFKAITALLHKMKPVVTDIRGIGISAGKLKSDKLGSSDKVSRHHLGTLLFTKSASRDQSVGESVVAHGSRTVVAEQQSECMDMDCSIEIPQPSEIDLDVLQALPETMRRTIVRKFQTDAGKSDKLDNEKESSKSRQPSQKQAVVSNLDCSRNVGQSDTSTAPNNVPSGSLTEKLKHRPSSYSEISDVLERMDSGEFENAKFIITSWATSKSLPPPLDVLQMATYIVQLIKTKYLDSAEMLMRYLMYAKRTRPLLNICVQEIVTAVQDTMTNVYGAPMALDM